MLEKCSLDDITKFRQCKASFEVKNRNFNIKTPASLAGWIELYEKCVCLGGKEGHVYVMAVIKVQQQVQS
jgi:hypothetical protein